jgi:hypothetical protein
MPDTITANTPIPCQDRLRCGQTAYPQIEFDPSINIGFYIIGNNGDIWEPTERTKIEVTEQTDEYVIFNEVFKCKKIKKSQNQKPQSIG